MENIIATIADEIPFILVEQISQINYDISLLRNNVDEIGQIIFSTELLIIPTDILTNTS